MSRDEVRARLIHHHGLDRIVHSAGPAGVRAVLQQLRCIQIDPLDPWGTNADLVALARVDGYQRGDLYRHLFPGHAFEHFAKERCFLPAEAFPFYRHQPPGRHWFSHALRARRLPKGALEAVLAEIMARGPLAADDLTDHGRVKAIDWGGGWAGTRRASSMAIEVLWGRCEIVVCGRNAAGRKLYDVPERALPAVHAAPGGDFHRWAVLHRVAAAGLLARTGGSMWAILNEARTSSLPDELIEEGLLESVSVEGAARPYLAPAGFHTRAIGPTDERLRVLGPLDPLLWDRKLVRNVFDFEYLWEVYKPPAQRRWGWYVCPLLHRGKLVGRIEGAVKGDALKVRNIWRERTEDLDQDALDEALQRHAAACGVERVSRPKRVRVG